MWVFAHVSSMPFFTEEVSNIYMYICMYVCTHIYIWYNNLKTKTMEEKKSEFTYTSLNRVMSPYKVNSFKPWKELIYHPQISSLEKTRVYPSSLTGLKNQTWKYLLRSTWKAGVSHHTAFTVHLMDSETWWSIQHMHGDFWGCVNGLNQEPPTCLQALITPLITQNRYERGRSPDTHSLNCEL